MLSNQQAPELSTFQKIKALQQKLSNLAEIFQNHPQKELFRHLLVDRLFLSKMSREWNGKVPAETLEVLEEKMAKEQHFEQKYKSKIKEYFLKTLPPRQAELPLVHEQELNESAALFDEISKLENLSAQEKVLRHTLYKFYNLYKIDALERANLELLWNCPEEYLDTICNRVISNSYGNCPNNSAEVRFILHHPEKAEQIASILYWFRSNSVGDFKPFEAEILALSNDQLEIIKSFRYFGYNSSVPANTLMTKLFNGVVANPVAMNAASDATNIRPELQFPEVKVKVVDLQKALELHDRLEAIYTDLEKEEAEARLKKQKPAEEKAKENEKNEETAEAVDAIATTIPKRPIDLLRQYLNLSDEFTPSLNPEELSELVWLTIRVENPPRRKAREKEIFSVLDEAQCYQLSEKMFSEERSEFFHDDWHIGQLLPGVVAAAFCVEPQQMVLLPDVLRAMGWRGFGGVIYGGYEDKQGGKFHRFDWKDILMMKPLFEKKDKEALNNLAHGLVFLNEFGLRNPERDTFLFNHPKGCGLFDAIRFYISYSTYDKEDHSDAHFNKVKAFAPVYFDLLVPLMMEIEAKKVTEPVKEKVDQIDEVKNAGLKFLKPVDSITYDPFDHKGSYVRRVYLSNGCYLTMETTSELNRVKNYIYKLYDDQTHELKATLTEVPNIQNMSFIVLSSRFMLSNTYYITPSVFESDQTLFYGGPPGEHKLKIWDLQNQTEIKLIEDFYSYYPLPNGKVALMTNQLAVYDPETQTEKVYPVEVKQNECSCSHYSAVKSVVSEIEHGLVVRTDQGFELLKENGERSILNHERRTDHLKLFKDSFIYFKPKEFDRVQALFNPVTPQTRMIRLKLEVDSNQQPKLEVVEDRIIPALQTDDRFLSVATPEIAKDQFLIFQSFNEIYGLDLNNAKSQPVMLWQLPKEQRNLNFKVLRDGRILIESELGRNHQEVTYEVNYDLIKQMELPSVRAVGFFVNSTDGAQLEAKEEKKVNLAM